MRNQSRILPFVLMLSLLCGYSSGQGTLSPTASTAQAIEAARTDEEKAEAYYQHGMALFDEKNATAALETLWEGMYLAAKSRLSGPFQKLYKGGKKVILSRSNPSAQMDFYNKAHALVKLAGFKLLESDVCNDIGNLYMRQGEHEKALQYFEQARIIAHEQNQTVEMAIALSNLGIVHKRMGNTEKAMTYYRQALEVGEMKGHNRLVSASHNNMAVVMEDRGDYENALFHFEKSLDLDTQGGSPEDLCISQFNVGMTLRKMNRLVKAREFLLDAIKTATENKLYYIADVAYDELSVLEAQSGRYKDAYDFHKLKSIYADSAQQQANKQEFSEMQLRLEFEHKESLLKAEQDKRDALAEETLRRNRLRSYALGGGLLLSIMLVLVVWRGYQRKQKDNLLIENQKKDVESKNREITESITYAKRIQSAILPPVNSFDRVFKESFVYYLPKDIVAGDFFWLEQINGHTMVAAADCTGHGVPGALVSIICHNALNRSVREYGLTTPGEILDKTREIVISEFEKSTEDVKDGMDISLLCIKEDRISWAGANNTLFHLQKGSLTEIKGDKQPIGKSENPKPFSSHTIQAGTGDVLYLLTDGYCDQFGGPLGKKFKTATLKAIFMEIHTLPMAEQKSLLAEKFQQWRGPLEQVDDVCIIGIRI